MVMVKLCRNRETGVVFVCDGFIENLPYMEVIKDGEEESKREGKKVGKEKGSEQKSAEEKKDDTDLG